MTPYVFRPRVEWGYTYDPQSYDFRWPMRPWDVEDHGVGGHAVAASGIAESYAMREDTILRVEIRIEEDELPELRAWLTWARRSGMTFVFYLDRDDAGTSYECWLHAPVWPDGIRYGRDSETPTVLVVPVALRLEVGQVLTHTWGEF